MLPLEKTKGVSPLKTIKNNRSALILSLLILVIFLGSIGAYFFLKQQTVQGPVAEIYQDGKLISEIELDAVEENYTFTVEGDDGIYNTIEVHHGEIGVVDASCPDGICRQMGFVHSSDLPITCLPNKLVIVIRSNEDTDTLKPDAVVR